MDPCRALGIASARREAHNAVSVCQNTAYELHLQRPKLAKNTQVLGALIRLLGLDQRIKSANNNVRAACQATILVLH
ncbi:hypothetical protein EBB07_19780 [Paenibacillaceae bacterium]|nr:hypothetical protein EBB07_19780 [Paenibacillaceae bacterium]